MWRKSWVRQNIHGEGEEVAKKRLLLPDERSVWDDYLDMAAPPNTPVAGQVCIYKGVGYTAYQIADLLKTPAEVVERAEKRMVELGMITVENSRVVIINNWKVYQSEYERQKTYRSNKDELPLEVTDDGNKKRKEDKIRKYVKGENKTIYTRILAHWNTKKIILHRALSDAGCSAINSKLKFFGADELCTAIDNYAMILHGKAYFWTHRWTLVEFLQRGVDKFTNLDIAKANYANKFKNSDEEYYQIKEELEDIRRNDETNKGTSDTES